MGFDLWGNHRRGWANTSPACAGSLQRTAAGRKGPAPAHEGPRAACAANRAATHRGRLLTLRSSSDKIAAVLRPSRNDIVSAAYQFAAEWKNETRERGESQTFWGEFLSIFGVQRRRVNAAFERHARRQSTGGTGFIDLLWPGMLLAEQKSRGSDLDEAMGQALDYIDSLNEVDLPRLVVVSDFAEFHVLDLEDSDRIVKKIPIDELPQHIDVFLILAGYVQRKFKDEDVVNVHAAELLGRLYFALEDSGYTGHPLRVFIVRILLLLFADDSGLWAKNQLQDIVLNRTAEDGSDLGMWLNRLFSVLDTEEAKRTKTLDSDLASFPYVNGGLFHERMEPPDMDRSMRLQLLAACNFNWSQISPAIFGAIFQSVMDPDARRSIGAHYTSEKNILKVVGPLFADRLWDELEQCGSSKQRLRALHDRIASLRFLDPACGCGNFLLIAYRELRRIEREILVRQYPNGVQMTLDLATFRKVSIDQFYGIEIEEFPARIAETAMYLMDHLENESLSSTFGINLVDLPLRSTARIFVDNALRVNWNDVLPSNSCNYVLGNPPFRGQYLRDVDQVSDLKAVWGKRYNGYLDYVTGWYIKTIEYDKLRRIKFAFVSTNSITQGEPVPYLWEPVLGAGYSIEFAHRSFAWSSEARGAAHVHCVIVGLTPTPLAPRQRQLFDYPHARKDPLVREVGNINPYLSDGPTLTVKSREAPLADWPPTMSWGSKPVDGGHLVVKEKEFEHVSSDPIARKYLRSYIGSRELLDSKDRWCLWLEDASPSDIRNSPILRDRLERCREFRLASRKPITQRLAESPGRFAEVRQPRVRYLAVPQTSSENRALIPMAYLDADVIASNALYTISDANLLIFGFLQSAMFMAWVRAISGRLESRFQIAPGPVYNTFPFPAVSVQQKSRVEDAAQDILEERRRAHGESLSALYHPGATPRDLQKAHAHLDRVIDQCFGKRSALRSDGERLAVLFERYSTATAG